MTNWTELKRLAEAQQSKFWVRDDGRLSMVSGQRMYGVDGPEYVSCWEDYGFTRAAAAFIAAANPKTILALIAENERLSEELSSCTESPGGCGYWREAARHREAERDKLRAEVDALRKDAERWRFLCDGDHKMIIAQMTEFDGVCEIGCDPIEYDFAIDSMMEKNA